MCLFVNVFTLLCHYLFYFTIIYFCKNFLYDTKILCESKKRITLEFVHSFGFVKFADTVKITKISLRRAKGIAENV